MNLIKIAFAFIIVFLTQEAFSQSETTKYPQVKVIDKDTVVMFTFAQGKQLAKVNEDKKRLSEMNLLMKKQLSEQDTIIQNQSIQLENYAQIKIDYDEIVKQKTFIESTCIDEKEILNDEIKRQKRHKWFGISGGILISGIITYFYITK